MPKPYRITPAMCASGRTIAEPRLSPNGSTVVFVSIIDGRASLVKVPSTGGPEVILSHEPRPASAHAFGGGVVEWLPDGSGVVFVGADDALWEIGVGGGPARLLVSATDELTSPAISPSGVRVAYVVDQHDLYVVDRRADPEAPTPVAVRVPTTASFVLDPIWLDDDRLAWHEWDDPHMPWDESRIALGTVDALAESHGGGQHQQPVRLGDTVAFLSDRNGWLNLWLAGGERPLLDESFEHGGSTWGARQRTVAASPDGRSVAVVRNESGFGRLVIIDTASGATREVARAVHASIDWRGDRLVAIRTGGVTPPQLVCYDTSTWERTVLVHGLVAGFEGAVIEPEPFTYRGFDGAELYGRRYDPADGPTGRAIVWIHGGPTGQTDITFMARVAFFNDRGWTVLMVDHRGSTGHGRAFTQALHGRWGELDTDDTAAVVDHARSAGWADRFVAMGGSAGGLTVLNLLASFPGRFVAGVALFPVTDLEALAATTHRYEAHYCDSLIGPLPDAIERYHDRSPLHRAEAIVDPVLLLHGADDKVVSVEQSEAFVARLRDLGRRADLVVYPNEGHGWKQPATVIDELERIHAFLDTHCGSRP